MDRLPSPPPQPQNSFEGPPKQEDGAGPSMPTLLPPKIEERARSPRVPVPRLGTDVMNPRIEALANDGVRTRSRAGSPRGKTRTPKPGTPKPGTPKDGRAAGSSTDKSPDVLSRPLNVTDALSYLDAVKMQFHDKPDVYNHFLDIMKDFKSQIIDTPGVIERVSMLFQGNPFLIQGFNTFLPPGYHIECSQDPHDHGLITVTTPMGIMTQGGNVFNPLRMQTAGSLTPGIPGMPGPGVGHPFGIPGGLPPVMGPLSNTTGSRPGTRPGTPQVLQLASIPPQHQTIPAPFSPGLHAASTKAAATFLGGLNGNNGNPVDKSQGEFNHAIQYLNKIKTRFSDDPNTYKQFLEILQTYQKEQRHLHDSQVYAQVQMLFKEAPDLLDEFKDFLPDAVNAAAHQNGLVGILPHPPGGSVVGGSSWPHADPLGVAAERAEKSRAPAKRKKRPAEPESTPVPAPKSTASRSKKQKNYHKPDAPSPAGSPRPAPASPNAHPYATIHHGHIPNGQPAHNAPHPHHAQAAGHAQGVHIPTHGPPRSTPEDLMFFEHVKKALSGREAYDEFLKLLNMYTTDVVDTKTLIRRAERLLGDGELLAQFKDLMGWDDRTGNVGFGPPGSIRTGPPEPVLAATADDGQGPSYRKLPESEVRLATSGRDELARSVLNDGWVSHPTWASEEAGFVAHKKNSFEEALHKSEEERHEYQVHIQGMARTIAVLEPLNARIEEMSPEERVIFKLRPNLGGSAKCIYQRTIKKVYGREAGMEVYQALQDCPSSAVPVVLARLKQKDEEWRRAQREWSRTWREVDHKNFYKSLDHQGIAFKANDKKSITAKHFVGDIESAKADLQRRRADAEVEAVGAGKRRRPSFARGSVGHQLEYSFVDTDVLHDALKMVYSFLDHSHALYSAPERRSVEEFLREFVPLLCIFPVHEFNAACGPRPDAGGAAIRPPVGENGVDAAGDGTSEDSAGAKSLKSPVVGRGDPRAEDVWIKESMVAGSSALALSPTTRRPFFCNTTFYTLLRLMQLLYSRLLICKEVGAQLAAQKYASLIANPVAVELGLDEPIGPSAVLAQILESLGGQGVDGKTNVLYMYLLDACEKLFDNDMDQATFEEHIRWFFGTKAFHVFTLDKVVVALIKQVQTIVSDNKCQELWDLLQTARAADTITAQDTVCYRRESEHHVGSDEHLYRIDWDSAVRTMRIQLLGPNDPSVDEVRLPSGRWREYVASYVTRHPTEWTPAAATTRPGCPLFLRRSLPGDDESADSDSEGAGSVFSAEGLAVRITLGSYKMFFETGSEDVLYRRRDADEEAELAGRARARGEERLRAWRAYL